MQLLVQRSLKSVQRLSLAVEAGGDRWCKQPVCRSHNYYWLSAWHVSPWTQRSWWWDERGGVCSSEQTSACVALLQVGFLKGFNFHWYTVIFTAVLVLIRRRSLTIRYYYYYIWASPVSYRMGLSTRALQASRIRTGFSSYKKDGTDDCRGTRSCWWL